MNRAKTNWQKIIKRMVAKAKRKYTVKLRKDKNMCDGPKDPVLLQRQYQKAFDEDIEIIQIEYFSGRIHWRDRFSVGRILADINKPYPPGSIGANEEAKKLEAKCKRNNG